VKVENRTLDNERDQRRFMREARAAGRMSSHPHVVDLFDVGVTVDQHPYLIMEMCDGSYADRMRTSPLNAFEARDVGVKIADALADAHHLGVLHRDVKPANVLYSRFNEPALADFGLAVLVEARDTSVTLEVLTPAYAPPEMFQHCPPSPQADVYALCASLYAIMRGKPPRWSDERNPSLIMLLELFNEPIPDLSGIHPALTEVLRLGMANDAADRPTAIELRDLLAAVPLGPHWSPAAPHKPPFSTTPVSSGPVTGSPVSGSPAHGPSESGGPASGDQVSPGGGPSPVGVPSAGPPQASPVPTGSHQQNAGGGWAHRPPATSRYVGRHPPTGGSIVVPAQPVRRQPRLRWLLGVLGVLVLLVVTSMGTWYVASSVASNAVHNGLGPVSPSRAAPSPGPSIGGGALPGCLLPLRNGLRCPMDLECFGPVSSARPPSPTGEVACGGRHTWEAFVIGDLPEDLVSADRSTVWADPSIRQACGESSFRTVSLLIDTTGWRFDVLLPDAETVASGDRAFRCLAGKGPGELVGPTLAG